MVSATDLTHNDMLKVVQDFSAKVAARGQNTVAMVYYAGHGVQLAGENYLVPVDAKISSPNELVSNSVRLVDVMATLESIPSRLRIVLLDACRNNPFPGSQRCRPRPCDRRRAERLDRRLFDRAGHRSARRHGRPQPLCVGVPETRAQGRTCRSNSCSSASASR